MKGNIEKRIEEKVKEFCKNTPRLREESGVVFAERLKDVLTEIANEARESILKEILGMVEKAARDIRLADKTPKYEYSRKKCDANTAGEFPEGIGTRWAMPREIAQSLLRNIESLITPPHQEEEELR